MLFGHQNDDTNQTQPADDQAAADTNASADVKPLNVDPDKGASLPAPPPPTNLDVAERTALNKSVSDTTGDGAAVSASDSTATAPSVPTIEPASLDAPDTSDAVTAPTETPELTSSTEETPTLPDSTTPTSIDRSTTTPSLPGSDDLLALKQQAIAQLSPLISQLDQTPEERFRTTMMLIQSTDNQSLIKDAYEAAQAITDEKVRAQALLDIVNEINYFTQPK